MNQLDADIRRFLARRIVRGAMVLALLIAVIAVTVPTVRGHAARRTDAREFSRIDTSVTNPSGIPVYSSATSTRDTRIAVGQGLAGVYQGVAVAMVFVALVLGASFVGAEFYLGSLTSQLLYEPRRWRVHLSKAATAALGCAAFAALFCVVLGGLIFVGSEVNGVVKGLDASWWQHRAVQVGRAAGASAAAGALAHAVTVVMRRTSAAIVVFFVMYPIIGIIHPDNAHFGWISRFAPLRGLLSVAIDPGGNGNGSTTILTRTSAGGIALTVVWVVVLIAASGALFSRSEVR